MASVNTPGVQANEQEQNGVFTLGNARFSVISPHLIRLEYQDQQKFIDSPTLFAINRDQFIQPTFVKKDGNILRIETEVLVLNYTNDGKSFHDGNLAIEIKGDRNITWNPELENKKNLGGTIHTLDQVKGLSPWGRNYFQRWLVFIR